jgi:hypothetical protein
LSAPTFDELRRRYPRQTRQFIVPILRDLQQAAVLAPDERIATQVFQAKSKPELDLVKKIEQVLAKFESDDFHERERAADDLATLGQPAAMALSQMDRKGWSLDRSSGVDSFLAKFKALPEEEIVRLQSDPVFLLDCLYSENTAVRTGAGALLSKMTGIQLDANSKGLERDQMVERISEKLFPAPATKPVAKE